jgi:putative toxin-antitoxin system antitoxin component (TIGR02293 family)
MRGLKEGRPAFGETTELQRVTDLLGGQRVLRQAVRDPIEAHEMLLGGLPANAVTHLVGKLQVMREPASLEKALGMSLRTFQRRKESSAKPLNAEQSGRTWKFAEILARATAVFGSQEEAERWLERPATGLNQHRPIDLLVTPAGVELVETFLQQIHYGAYV